jgi:hypothetical protein
LANQGQLWSSVAQWGLETTAGTAVAATRKMYLREPVLSRERAPRVHRFATGTRDNVRAYTNGPITASGSFSMPLSAAEILEVLAISVQGGVTATTPSGATNARLFTYKPVGSLDSITMEWDDGARVYEGVGMRGNSMTIAGSAMEENTVSVDLFGTDVTVGGSLTGALSERTPSFFEGWQTRLYIDSFSATPGTTPMPGLLRNWSVQFNNNLGRVYTADNTLAANRITSGELDITATLTFDAYAAQTATEFANWDATTLRMLRLEFLGPADGIEAGANEVQTVNTTGVPTGGTFTLRVLGQTTAAIDFDATAGEVQTAINNALAVLGTGHTVACTVGPLTTDPVTVTFSGAQVAGREIPTMSMVTNSLTGGTAPSTTFGTTTPGRSGREYVVIDLPGAWTSVNLGGSADGVRTYEMGFQSIYQSTLASMASIAAQTSRTAMF